jgi:ubiquinone/menaquinone biosynthesis C-methylase UbiE
MKNTEKTTNWKDKTILLVDDECDTNELKPLIKFLDYKYRLIKASSDRDAKEHFLFDDSSIDCVILDINLGSTMKDGGIKLLEEMRKTDPYLPIGMITKYDDDYKFETGQKKATFHCRKQNSITDTFIDELDRNIENSIQNTQFLYDRNLMEMVNKSYADTYDIKEYAKPGTLAFCYWEDEIVMNLINNGLSGENFKILDVACGTGRFENLIVRRCEKSLEKLVGIDFAGRMLTNAKEKLKKNKVYIGPDGKSNNYVQLKRGFAEMLPFPDEEFDLVICGFGVPSYTKFNLSIPEAYRVLRPGGKALFTVYNKNALFNKVADYFHPSFSDRCPMASWVKFEPFPECDNEGKYKEGKYKLVPQGDLDGAFPIQPFSIIEIITLLNRFGFKMESKENIKSIYTFPILCSITPTDLISYDKNKDSKSKQQCFGNWPEYSVSEVEKVKEVNESFSWQLYQIDNEYARKLDDGGFFITVVVEKVVEAEKVHKYDE